MKRLDINNLSTMSDVQIDCKDECLNELDIEWGLPKQSARVVFFFFFLN